MPGLWRFTPNSLERILPIFVGEACVATPTEPARVPARFDRHGTPTPLGFPSKSTEKRTRSSIGRSPLFKNMYEARESFDGTRSQNAHGSLPPVWMKFWTFLELCDPPSSLGEDLCHVPDPASGRERLSRGSPREKDPAPLFSTGGRASRAREKCACLDHCLYGVNVGFQRKMFPGDEGIGKLPRGNVFRERADRRSVAGGRRICNN